MIYLAVISILAMFLVLGWLAVIVVSAAAEIDRKHREDERP